MCPGKDKPPTAPFMSGTSWGDWGGTVWKLLEWKSFLSLRDFPCLSFWGYETTSNYVCLVRLHFNAYSWRLCADKMGCVRGRLNLNAHHWAGISENHKAFLNKSKSSWEIWSPVRGRNLSCCLLTTKAERWESKRCNPFINRAKHCRYPQQQSVH